MKFQKGVLSLATLALLAACSGHKHKESAAGGNGESPVAVKFTQAQGASLTDRLEFGGQVAVSSYSVDLACGSNSYHLKGGRMLVRTGETACASTLTSIVVTDQHGLRATFSNAAADTAPHTLSALEVAQYPNLRLDISGAAQPDGTSVAYTYTLRDSAQGQNTTGSNGGDIGTSTSVSIAGVPLPDVSPNKATAWAVIDGSGTAGSFSASIAAESTAPCGAAADYAVELYAQTAAGSTPTTERAAYGVTASTSSAPVAFTNQAATSIIQDCRGLTTNLYLKLSCTNAIGTSYKLVAIQSQIPNSPYTDIGQGTSHVCANAAIASLPAELTADDAAAHPALFMPPPPSLSDYYTGSTNLAVWASNSVGYGAMSAALDNGSCTTVQNSGFLSVIYSDATHLSPVTSASICSAISALLSAY